MEEKAYRNRAIYHYYTGKAASTGYKTFSKAAIAQMFGISATRISQIIRKIEYNLDHPRKNKLSWR